MVKLSSVGHKDELAFVEFQIQQHLNPVKRALGMPLGVHWVSFYARKSFIIVRHLASLN